MHRRSPGGRRPRPGRAKTYTRRAAASSRAARRAATVRRRKPERGGRSAAATRSSRAVIDSPGQTLAHVAASARPCTQLARLETTLVRNTWQAWSSSSRRSGSMHAADASGRSPRPVCQSAERTNSARASGDATSPDCQAASRPPECAKPPVGNAESASCQTLRLYGDTNRHKNAFKSGAPPVLPTSLFQSISFPPDLRTTNTSARAGGRARAPLSGLPHPR